MKGSDILKLIQNFLAYLKTYVFCQVLKLDTCI